MKPVPTIHTLMIVITTTVLVVSLILYVFAPPEKADLLKGMIWLSSGALFGKYSNNFATGRRDRSSEENKQ